ncbi:MAG: SAF domain-containing protein [Peptococcaceae bacterium]|nr:SAF domain-containing protein [Peptococcaceae bacterium]MDH7525823.1 SAF domain-containing protein [Peptococcaceae bacterium]
MRKQRLALIVLGLLISLGSAWFMYSSTERFVQKAPVVVASREIEPLERFTPENVRVVFLPAQYVLPGAVTTVDAVAGRLAGTRLYEGEQVLGAKIDREEIVPAQDERYLFIPYNKIVLTPGQKIDLYLLYNSEKSPYAGAEKVLADKVVASVINEAGQDIHHGAKINEMSKLSGIEIIVTEEEIKSYLEKVRYAKEYLVRQKQGG